MDKFESSDKSSSGSTNDKMSLKSKKFEKMLKNKGKYKYYSRNKDKYRKSSEKEH